MDNADITELNRRWVAQWRTTGPLLEAIRAEELRAMTEEQARAASEMLLAAAPIPGDPRTDSTTSGLVEQQRIFARARKC